MRQWIKELQRQRLHQKMARERKRFVESNTYAGDKLFLKTGDHAYLDVVLNNIREFDEEQARILEDEKLNDDEIPL